MKSTIVPYVPSSFPPTTSILSSELCPRCNYEPRCPGRLLCVLCVSESLAAVSYSPTGKGTHKGDYLSSDDGYYNEPKKRRSLDFNRGGKQSSLERLELERKARPKMAHQFKKKAPTIPPCTSPPPVWPRPSPAASPKSS